MATGMLPLAKLSDAEGEWAGLATLVQALPDSGDDAAPEVELRRTAIARYRNMRAARLLAYAAEPNVEVTEPERTLFGQGAYRPGGLLNNLYGGLDIGPALLTELDLVGDQQLAAELLGPEVPTSDVRGGGSSLAWWQGQFVQRGNGLRGRYARALADYLNRAPEPGIDRLRRRIACADSGRASTLPESALLSDQVVPSPVAARHVTALGPKADVTQLVVALAKAVGVQPARDDFTTVQAKALVLAVVSGGEQVEPTPIMTAASMAVADAAQAIAVAAGARRS